MVRNGRHGGRSAISTGPNLPSPRRASPRGEGRQLPSPPVGTSAKSMRKPTALTPTMGTWCPPSPRARGASCLHPQPGLGRRRSWPVPLCPEPALTPCPSPRVRGESSAHARPCKPTCVSPAYDPGGESLPGRRGLRRRRLCAGGRRGVPPPAGNLPRLRPPCRQALHGLRLSGSASRPAAAPSPAPWAAGSDGPSWIADAANFGD